VNPSVPHWDALKDVIGGKVVLSDSPGYDSFRKPANARFHDVWPRAVVRCETPEDVSETVCFAGRSGLRTAIRSGGHCFAGHSSTEGIVVDVSPMSSVSVSGDVTTVGAGARLGDLYDALDEHGLTIPAGCGPSVGISGLTLGGGLGILGRKHGLTSDSLLGAQIILADASSSATIIATGSCSGPCAAQAPTSAWSRLSSSRPSRRRPRRSSTCSGRTPTRPGSSKPGRLGHPTGPTSSPPACF
jgi:FAD/FMN-containing dehydrogenase